MRKKYTLFSYILCFLLVICYTYSLSYASLQQLLTKTFACLVVAFHYEFDFPFQQKYFSLTIMREGQRVYVL